MYFANRLVTRRSEGLFAPWRGSSTIYSTNPCSRALGASRVHIVLSFHTHSNSPASPTRWWAMKGDLLDKIETTPAEAAITGLALTKKTVPTVRSIVARKLGVREVPIAIGRAKTTPSKSSIVTGPR
jgi:hypothetical protein